MSGVFISEWARESLTLTEMAEVQAWAKVNGERVELRYSRSGKCFTATVGTRQVHDQRRAIEAFRKAGLRAVAADNRREYGIQRVQQRLATAKDGRPRLFLCEEALEEVDLSLQERRQPVSTEQEFASYVYPMGKDGRPVAETPVEENDHGMDAMRYAVRQVERARMPLLIRL